MVHRMSAVLLLPLFVGTAHPGISSISFHEATKQPTLSSGSFVGDVYTTLQEYRCVLVACFCAMRRARCSTNKTSSSTILP